MRYSLALSLLAVLLGTPNVQALPKLQEPVPLPAKFTDIITIYPDNENTALVRKYWLVPSTARIVKKPDGKLSFGLVHSGLSSFDPDGISGLLTITFQPYIDQTSLNEAKQLITTQDTAAGATSTFSYINPTESTCQLMVGGHFVDWNGQTKTIISGGTVEAGIPFQFKTTNNLDVRALSQAGGGDANTIGVLYTMKFRGVGKRIHYTIDADYKQTLDHYKAAVSGSAWFGLVKAKASAEWTKFKDLPYVKVTVLEGTEDDVDKYMKEHGAQKLINTLMEQLANRTGMFARTVQPSNLPDAPGGGGIFGWGVSVGGGFEHVENETALHYEEDLNFTEDREITFGMTFPSSSEDLKPYVKNLTDTNKPFPTGDDYKKIADQNAKCLKDNLVALKSLYDQGLIPQDVYLDLVRDAVTKGCHVKYEGVTRAAMEFAIAAPGYSALPLKHTATPSEIKAARKAYGTKAGSLVPSDLLLEFKRRRLPTGQVPPRD